MATIITIAAGDQITNSRADLNTNFSNLNSDKIETSVLDTDTALTANSDAKVATQKAVKAYVDAGGNINASTTAKGIVEEATQAEVTAGTAAGATGARLFINPSSTISKLPNTQVFNGASPTTMTDLDLSSVVGAKSCVVLLKVKNAGAASDLIYIFRKNGETNAQSLSTHSGTSTTGILAFATTQFAYVIVPTDSSGIVEWSSYTGGAGTSQTTVIHVEAYW